MELDVAVNVPAAEYGLGVISVTLIMVVAGPKTAVGVPLTVQPAPAPVTLFQAAAKPAGEVPVKVQTYVADAGLPPVIEGSAAPTFKLEYAAVTSPFPSVAMRDRAGKI